MRVLNEVVQRMPVYLLNSVNPYRLEGQKTAAIELLEQLDWQSPDHVIVPGGNLGNSSALGKAFHGDERARPDFTSLPRLSVIQAEGANALVRTLRENNGRELISVQAETMATAIRIGHPASWKKAVRALEATGGTVEQVSEIEIAQAKAEIGAEGIGCEPASAVTLAGLKKLSQARLRETIGKRGIDPDRPSRSKIPTSLSSFIAATSLPELRKKRKLPFSPPNSARRSCSMLALTPS